MRNEEVGMAGISLLSRIEDFIAVARSGRTVLSSIELLRVPVIQKVHPGGTEDMKSEIQMYLLSANYNFTVGKDSKKVSKVYVYGSAEESLNDAKINKHIANERLKMDYKRMQEVKIQFEEKYF
jgi:hypothetical protein